MITEVTEEVEQYLEDTSEPPLHEQFTADELIDYYVNIRNRKKEIEEKHKEELAPFVKGLEDIEYSLSILLDGQDTTSMKGSSGTASYRTYTSIKVVDRFVLDKWVQDTGNTEVYESRVSKSALKELNLEAPPGTEKSEYRKVIVTAPRKR